MQTNRNEYWEIMQNSALVVQMNNTNYWNFCKIMHVSNVARKKKEIEEWGKCTSRRLARTAICLSFSSCPRACCSSEFFSHSAKILAISSSRSSPASSLANISRSLAASASFLASSWSIYPTHNKNIGNHHSQQNRKQWGIRNKHTHSVSPRGWGPSFVLPEAPFCVFFGPAVVVNLFSVPVAQIR